MANLAIPPYMDYDIKETMEEINIDRIGFNGDKAKLILPYGYEFKTEGNEVYVVKKKPKYPKTYEECCNILNAEETYLGIGGHKGKLLQRFQRLLICRDAYWKIAGDWKPDYDSGVDKYGMISFNGKVGISNPTTHWERHLGKLLDFPTEEMRDAFYENFKELINEAKELL